MTFLGFALCVMLYFSGKGKSENMALSAYNICFSLWCFGQYMGETSVLREAVFFWTKFNLTFVTLLPAVYLLFVFSFLKTLASKIRVLIFAFTGSVLFMFFIQNGAFIRSIRQTQFFRYYPEAGPAYPVFGVFFLICVIIGFVELSGAYLGTTGERKNKIAYVWLASLIGFSGSVFWFLPVFGFDVYPFGIFILPVYLLVTAYAIIKKDLFYIKIAVRRAMAASLIIAIFSFVLIFFSASAVLILRLDVKEFRSVFIPVFLLFVVMLYDPANVFVRKLTDRFLFRGYLDPEMVAKDLNAALRCHIYLGEMSSSIVEALGRNFLLKDVEIYTRDGQNYLLRSSTGFSGVVAFYCAQVILPLELKDSIVGFILLGPKSSGEMWNTDDLVILNDFSFHAAAMLENAAIFEKVSGSKDRYMQSQQLLTVGSLAASVAHDIKNPLTSIKGLVQNLRENISDGDFMASFLDIVPRQIERINSSIDALLSKAKSKLPSPSIIMAGDIVSDVEFMLRHQAKDKNITLEIDKRGDFEQKCDPAMLALALQNIILNALQATQEGGAVTIIVEELRILINDTGKGMSELEVSRIFQPFFTTKENGLGLGLFTAYNTIKSLGGSIEVRSEIGKGTEFVIDFA